VIEGNQFDACTEAPRDGVVMVHCTLRNSCTATKLARTSTIADVCVATSPASAEGTLMGGVVGGVGLLVLLFVVVVSRVAVYMRRLLQRIKTSIRRTAKADDDVDACVAQSTTTTHRRQNLPCDRCPVFVVMPS
jgi:hypothetical protein